MQTQDQSTSEPKRVESERLLQTLLRPIAARRKFSRQDLEAILESTLQKLLETIRAEVVAVYSVEGDGQIHFRNVSYSRSLGIEESRRKEKWYRMVENRDSLVAVPGQGVVGKVVKGLQPYIAYQGVSEDDLREDLATRAGFKVNVILNE